jgi:hypothetical protein
MALKTLVTRFGQLTLDGLSQTIPSLQQVTRLRTLVYPPLAMLISRIRVRDKFAVRPRISKIGPSKLPLPLVRCSM